MTLLSVPPMSSGTASTDPLSLLDLLKDIVGPENVLHDPRDLLVYECDAYTLEKHLPSCVLLPANTEETARIVKLCADHHVPIIPRGAGTSLSGAVLAVEGGVMIAMTRMNHILSVDVRNRRALVESGCVNAWITQAVKQHGLYYAPDPSSQPACTVGGNVAMNSGGPHTLKYGVTTNHVLGMEVVLPDGTVQWLGARPEDGGDIEGYDLRGAFIGCEGMFGIVTRVLVRLIRSPQSFKTMLAVFGNVADASQTVSDIIAAGIIPGAMEMMDQMITTAIEQAYRFGFPLDAGAVLIIELDGLTVDLESQSATVMDICRRNNSREVRLAGSEAERLELWKCRKRAFGAIGRLSPNFLTQDGVVPRSKLPDIMAFIEDASRKHGLRIPNVFHAGDGNIHPLILYDERDPQQVRKAIQAGDEILHKCIELGGSVTGEHGIGVEKTSFMALQFGPSDLEAMHRLRGVFDPETRCNPHKMFPGGKRCGDFAPRKQAAA